MLLISYWILLTTSIADIFLNWLSQNPYPKMHLALPGLNGKFIIFLALFCPLYIWYWHNKLNQDKAGFRTCFFCTHF